MGPVVAEPCVPDASGVPTGVLNCTLCFETISGKRKRASKSKASISMMQPRPRA